MRPEIRHFLLEDNPDGPQRVAEFFDAPTPADDLEDILDDATFDAAQRMDPSLSRASDLMIRLTGEETNSGAPMRLLSELFEPLQKSVSAAANEPRQRFAFHSTMDVASVGEGSIVLHLRPRRPVTERTENQLDLPVATVDTAIKDLLDLLNSLERQADPVEISHRANERQALLRAIRDFVEILDKHSLNMTARWWTSLNENKITSSLTERGRTHAKGVFNQVKRDQVENIQGRVVAIDLGGKITLEHEIPGKKPGKSPAVSRTQVGVDPGIVEQFTLGENVHISVQRAADVDDVGISTKPQFTYIGAYSEQEELP